MTLDEFKNSIQIITGDEAGIIRALFIETFVNQESKYYKEYDGHRRQVSEVEYFNYYLWGVFTNKKRIGEGLAKAIISEKDRVYVMWDTGNMVHGTNNYLNFPDNSVLTTTNPALLCNLDYLPEDIYIFDDTFSWAVTLTHENGGRWNKRYCLSATPDRPQSNPSSVY